MNQMSGVAQQFWLIIISSLAGVSSTGLLIMAALFSEGTFQVGTTGYIAATAIALVSFGIIIWQVAVGGLTESDSELSRP